MELNKVGAIMEIEKRYKTEKEILQEFENIFEKYKEYLYSKCKLIDRICYKIILLTSVLNRSLALIEGYKKILSTNNIMVLNSLTRLQLDNCIFIYGIRILIDNGYNVDELGSAIISDNKKLSSYKIGKQKLNDKYLISEIDKKYNNKIKDMYDFYCRFVHFSDSALLSASEVLDNNILSLELTKDYSRFKKPVIENANSFINLCKFLLILLNQEWDDIPNGKTL